MRPYIYFFSSVFCLVAAVFFFSGGTASASGNCQTFSTGTLTSFASANVTIECNAPTTVFAGVCDRGDAPHDDFFTVTFGGATVSQNEGGGSEERVSVFSTAVPAGTSTFSVNSVSDSGFAPYAVAISPDIAEVGYNMLNRCGMDYSGQSEVPGACLVEVPLHTEDGAPSSGRLIFNVLYGQSNRPEGSTLTTIHLSAGQRLEDSVLVRAPKWGRLWWQPSGSSQWFLLPSQYWQGDGTAQSEYGVGCDTVDVASYHTSFARAIPASEVPLFNP